MSQEILHLYYQTILNIPSQNMQTNTSNLLKYSSLICSKCCLHSHSSTFTLLGVSKLDCLEQCINLLCCRIILLNLDIFLFSCRFVMILKLCNSCEYDLWEFFIHPFFLFFFFSPNCRISNINFFLQGRLHHASTIMSWVSIVVEFVTFC
jgi:hypothetical protein